MMQPIGTRRMLPLVLVSTAGVAATEDDMLPATVRGEVWTTWVTPPTYAVVEMSGLEVVVARGMAPVALAPESK